MICEFTLPSNPAVKVRLREATVSEAIDFSAVDPDCEEEAASLFLDTVQDKETYSDPRQWTGEDRRYALFMYFVRTTQYNSISLTYECSICGKQHTQDIALTRILNDYTPMVGAPFREFPHQGHNVMVRPLAGADLEMLEKFRYDLIATEDKLANLRHTMQPKEIKQVEAEIRSKYVRMAMMRIICCVDMPWLAENSTPIGRRDMVRDKIITMPASEFREFMQRVDAAIMEMRHGLRTTYIKGRIMLEIPDVQCDLHPEEPGVLLHYPFRFSRVIPTI